MRKQGFRYGSEVEVSIRPAHKKYNLDDLIAQITPENRYPAIDWGPDVGREIVEWKE